MAPSPCCQLVPAHRESPGCLAAGTAKGPSARPGMPQGQQSPRSLPSGSSGASLSSFTLNKRLPSHACACCVCARVYVPGLAGFSDAGGLYRALWGAGTPLGRLLPAGKGRPGGWGPAGAARGAGGAGCRRGFAVLPGGPGRGTGGDSPGPPAAAAEPAGAARWKHRHLLARTPAAATVPAHPPQSLGRGVTMADPPTRCSGSQRRDSGDRCLAGREASVASRATPVGAGSPGAKRGPWPHGGERRLGEALATRSRDGACGGPLPACPPASSALQCERGDPPLRKVPIFSRGMKSFLVPAQNRSLRGPARKGAFGQWPDSLMGPAAGTYALPDRGVAAGLCSSPDDASRTLQVLSSPGPPLHGQPATSPLGQLPKPCCMALPALQPCPSGMNKPCSPAVLGPRTCHYNLPGCVGLWRMNCPAVPRATPIP